MDFLLCFHILCGEVSDFFFFNQMFLPESLYLPPKQPLGAPKFWIWHILYPIIVDVDSCFSISTPESHMQKKDKGYPYAGFLILYYQLFRGTISQSSRKTHISTYQTLGRLVSFPLLDYDFFPEVGVGHPAKTSLLGLACGLLRRN